MKEGEEYLPWMTIATLVTHNPVDITTTILFLFQMAMLESFMRVSPRKNDLGCKELDEAYMQRKTKSEAAEQLRYPKI